MRLSTYRRQLGRIKLNHIYKIPHQSFCLAFSQLLTRLLSHLVQKVKYPGTFRAILGKKKTRKKLHRLLYSTNYFRWNRALWLAETLRLSLITLSRNQPVRITGSRRRKKNVRKFISFGIQNLAIFIFLPQINNSRRKFKINLYLIISF